MDKNNKNNNACSLTCDRRIKWPVACLKHFICLCYILVRLLSNRAFVCIDCFTIGDVHKDNDTWQEYSPTIPAGLHPKQCFRRTNDSCTAGRLEIWLFQPVHFIHRPWNRCSKLTRRVVPLVCPFKHLIILFFKKKTV